MIIMAKNSRISYQGISTIRWISGYGGTVP